MEFWARLAQVAEVLVLLGAIVVAWYYSSQLKSHNDILVDEDELRAQREQEAAHERQMRRHERECGWSVYLLMSWFDEVGVFAWQPLKMPPRRPDHLHRGASPFYFGATCAHLTARPPAEVLSSSHDDSHPVAAMEAALSGFGMYALTRDRDTFLRNTYLSGATHLASDANRLVAAASVPPDTWSDYRFAVHLPATAVQAGPSGSHIERSLVWVHRIDVDAR